MNSQRTGEMNVTSEEPPQAPQTARIMQRLRLPDILGHDYEAQPELGTTPDAKRCKEFMRWTVRHFQVIHKGNAHETLLSFGEKAEGIKTWGDKETIALVGRVQLLMVMHEANPMEFGKFRKALRLALQQQA